MWLQCETTFAITADLQRQVYHFCSSANRLGAIYPVMVRHVRLQSSLLCHHDA